MVYFAWHLHACLIYQEPCVCWGEELKRMFAQHGSFDALEVAIKKKTLKSKEDTAEGGWFSALALRRDKGWTSTKPQLLFSKEWHIHIFATKHWYFLSTELFSLDTLAKKIQKPNIYIWVQVCYVDVIFIKYSFTQVFLDSHPYCSCLSWGKWLLRLGSGPPSGAVFEKMRYMEGKRSRSLLRSFSRCPTKRLRKPNRVGRSRSRTSSCMQHIPNMLPKISHHT